MLGIVLVHFKDFFGIPPSALYFLAAIPCFFAVYDLFSYFRPEEHLPGLLKGIAIMNFVYCIPSIALAVYHRSEITKWGWAYVIGEILILVVLAGYELKMSNSRKG